jgi:hypothetical protein
LVPRKVRSTLVTVSGRQCDGGRWTSIRRQSASER